MINNEAFGERKRGYPRGLLHNIYYSSDDDGAGEGKRNYFGDNATTTGSDEAPASPARPSTLVKRLARWWRSLEGLSTSADHDGGLTAVPDNGNDTMHFDHDVHVNYSTATITSTITVAVDTDDNSDEGPSRRRDSNPSSPIDNVFGNAPLGWMSRDMLHDAASSRPPRWRRALIDPPGLPRWRLPVAVVDNDDRSEDTDSDDSSGVNDNFTMEGDIGEHSDSTVELRTDDDGTTWTLHRVGYGTGNYSDDDDFVTAESADADDDASSWSGGHGVPIDDDLLELDLDAINLTNLPFGIDNNGTRELNYIEALASRSMHYGVHIPDVEPIGPQIIALVNNLTDDNQTDEEASNRYRILRQSSWSESDAVYS